MMPRLRFNQVVILPTWLKRLATHFLFLLTLNEPDQLY
jgi:hypothetical protein